MVRCLINQGNQLTLLSPCAFNTFHEIWSSDSSQYLDIRSWTIITCNLMGGYCLRETYCGHILEIEAASLKSAQIMTIEECFSRVMCGWFRLFKSQTVALCARQQGMLLLLIVSNTGQTQATRTRISERDNSCITWNVADATIRSWYNGAGRYGGEIHVKGNPCLGSN
jgi:hypothetical protein